MTEFKEMRFLLEKKLTKRFRVICAQLELSVPKQMAELIRNFVEIQEENLKNIGK